MILEITCETTFQDDVSVKPPYVLSPQRQAEFIAE